MASRIEQPTAADFMSREVVVASPEMGLEQLTEMLLASGVSNVPVVIERDHRRTLVGYISERDCLEHLSNEFYYRNPDATVGSMMKRHPVCVSAETDIFTLASVFMQHGYRNLPVIDGAELVGVVSRRDVLHGLFDYFRQVRDEEEAQRSPPNLEQIINLRFVCK